MLNILVQPLLNTQTGNVVISGSVSSTAADLYWGFDGESVTRTEGFLRNGQGFELTVILAPGSTYVQIQAKEGQEESEIVTVDLKGTGGNTVEASYQFNEFDELAQTVGVDRFPSESNVSFRDRCMDSKAYPGNASVYNRLRAIDRDLGLPALDPFFQLRLRWDPRTGEAYTRAWIQMKSNRCIYQELSFFKIGESHFANPYSGEIELSKTLGKELDDIHKVSIITSSGEYLPREAYTVTYPNTITVDWEKTEADPLHVLVVNYPYQEEFIFSGYDDVSGAFFSKTVADLKGWLLGLSTVTDEDSNVVSPLVWIDGTFEELTALPEGATPTAKNSVEQMWNTPATGYFSITENIDTEYYQFVPAFTNKALFHANQVVPSTNIELSTEPQTYVGSWSRIDNLFDDDFVEKITTTHEAADKNIKHYAELLREVTRMGIGNTLVDRDYWGSDHPERIGERFLSTIFDTSPTEYSVLTEAGAVSTISLKRRKYLARRLAGEKIF